MFFFFLPAREAWAKYVKQLAKDETQAQIADKAGVAQPTVSRWLRGTNPPTDAAAVAAFARAYGRNVLEAFVAAGMITIDEAGRALDQESRDFLLSLAQGMGVDTEVSARVFNLPGTAVANDGDIEEAGDEQA